MFDIFAVCYFGLGTACRSMFARLTVLRNSKFLGQFINMGSNLRLILNNKIKCLRQKINLMA